MKAPRLIMRREAPWLIPSALIRLDPGRFERRPTGGPRGLRHAKMQAQLPRPWLVAGIFGADVPWCAPSDTNAIPIPVPLKGTSISDFGTEPKSPTVRSLPADGV